MRGRFGSAPSIAAAVAAAVATGVAHGAATGPPAHAARSSDCAAGAATDAVRAFVAAFNAGDGASLDALFAPAPLFGWYSSNPPGTRRAAAAANRQTLLAYFRGRHAARDRLRLVTVRFNGNSAGFGHLVFRMKRSAADYRRGAWFELAGKAAVACDVGDTGARVRFVVVSLGGRGSG